MSRYRGVAFCGKMGSGKSTAADYLVDNYGASAYSLGYYVRQYLIENLEMDPEDVFAKPTPDYVRDMLQNVGHGLREYNEDIWLDQLLSDIETECELDEFLVVDDVRYDNEVRGLQGAGFYIVHLYRAQDHETPHGANHPSEDGLTENSAPNMCIVTLGGVEELQRLVRETMEEDVL